MNGTYSQVQTMSLETGRRGANAFLILCGFCMGKIFPRHCRNLAHRQNTVDTREAKMVTDPVADCILADVSPIMAAFCPLNMLLSVQLELFQTAACQNEIGIRQLITYIHRKV